MREVTVNGGTVLLAGNADELSDEQITLVDTAIHGAIAVLIRALHDNNVPPTVAVNALANLTYLVACELGPEMVAGLLDALPKYHAAMIVKTADA